MIDTYKALSRRQHAINIAQALVSLPDFPFGDDIPLSVIRVIESALHEWEKKQ